MKSSITASIVLFFLSCTSQKSTNPPVTDTTASSSTTVATNTETRSSSNPTKTAVLNNPDETSSKNTSGTQTDSDKENSAANKPSCIQKMISQFKQEEVQNPPRKIFSYVYNGNTVYYVPAQCCDFFSDLYDSNCELIGHPDGGFTGRGDGKMPEFIKKRSNEKLIWEDSRKYK